MTTTRKRTKRSVRYRLALFGWFTGRRCDTCVMFNAHTRRCSLVAGPIRPADVCDEWTADTD